MMKNKNSLDQFQTNEKLTGAAISWVRIFNVLTEILQNFIHFSPVSPRFFHIPRLSQAGAPDMLRMASRFPKCILNLWTYPYAQWGSHHPLGIVYMVSHDICVYMEIYGNVWKYSYASIQKYMVLAGSCG